MADDDDFIDPAEAERQISDFIAAAAPLPGPPVEQLADEVRKVLVSAWQEVGGVMAGVPHNKLLATMLLVGQRARQVTPDTPAQWQLHAAGSLLSGLVGQARPN